MTRWTDKVDFNGKVNVSPTPVSIESCEKTVSRLEHTYRLASRNRN